MASTPTASANSNNRVVTWASLPISERHVAFLTARANTPETARARGIRSDPSRDQLESMGYTPVQIGPGILIPIHPPAGVGCTYSFHPDDPLVTDKGKLRKYEAPTGSVIRLDVHPLMRDKLLDIKIPILVTEGVLKGDAAVAQGYCAVSIPGVYSWGGQPDILADWEAIPLEGRDVYVIFDSDTASNRQVRDQRDLLCVFLQHKKAIVHVVTLKPAKDGSKVGLDDYAVRGRIANLLEHAEGFGSSGSSLSARSEDAEWGPLLPLPAVSSVESMPLDMIPTSLQAFIQDITDRFNCSPEVPAVSTVAALSGVVGRGLGIRPDKTDDHVIVGNLWGCNADYPGSMKSAILKDAVRPLYRLDAEARKEQDASDSLDNEADSVVAGAEIDALKRRVKETNPGPEQEDAKRRLREKIAEKQSLDQSAPLPRRYWTTDATPEKLGMLLGENPRGLTVVRDELAGLFAAWTKAGHEDERPFYNVAWNGDSSYYVDRVGRSSIHMPALTLAVVGCTTPGLLARLVDSAAGGGDDFDGMLQRFQLLVYPERRTSWTRATHPADLEARESAYQIFSKLANLDAEHFSSAVTTNVDIPYVAFSSEAQLRWNDWRYELEHRLLSPELAETPAYLAYLGKERSLVPSLALIFHLSQWASGMPAGPVSATALDLAIQWAAYLETHARKVYEVELNPGPRKAALLLSKIKSGRVQHGTPVREIGRHQWAGLTNAADVALAIDTLNDCNLARTVTIEASVAGGRPSDVIHLHPELRNEFNGNIDGPAKTLSTHAETALTKLTKPPSVSFVSSSSAHIQTPELPEIESPEAFVKGSAVPERDEMPWPSTHAVDVASNGHSAADSFICPECRYIWPEKPADGICPKCDEGVLMSYSVPTKAVTSPPDEEIPF